MTDLRERLKAIEAAPPPDLWAGIEARAEEGRAGMDTNFASVEAFRKAGWDRRQRVLAGLVAAAVVAAITFAFVRAMGPAPITFPTGDPTAGWPRCTNATVGYTMAYPDGWHTTDVFMGQPEPANTCRWFSPTAFGPDGNVVAEGWGYPLEVAVRALPLEEQLAQTIDPEVARVLTRQELLVDGHRAFRLEFRTIQDLLADTGRHYEYLVEVDQRTTLVVHTTETRGIEGDYRANRRVVDLAVATLRFEGP